MKDRTKQILASLIRHFVESGTPIASQKLLSSGEFRVSSATVRNEFALLEKSGLIMSPHVSSGKVPTSKGYRFFVDQVVEEQKKLSPMRSEIQKRILAYKKEKLRQSLFDSLRILAQISQNVAFGFLHDDRPLYLGLGNVLRAPEFLESPEEAAQVVEVLEGQEDFLQFLGQTSLPEGKVKVFIGEENLISGLQSCSMLVTRFNGGFLGILGPMRMRYGFNMALLEEIREMIN